MGALGALGIQRLYQLSIRWSVNRAYMKLRKVCEPQTLNPNKPGNQGYMKSDARDSANVLIKWLCRAGFDPPSRCTLEEESLQQWFKFLEDVRIKIS